MNWSNVKERLGAQQADETGILRWAQSAEKRQALRPDSRGATANKDKLFGIVKRGSVRAATSMIKPNSESGQVYELVDKSPSGALLKVRCADEERWIPTGQHEPITSGEYKILSSDKELARRFARR